MASVAVLPSPSTYSDSRSPPLERKFVHPRLQEYVSSKSCSFRRSHSFSGFFPHDLEENSSVVSTVGWSSESTERRKSHVDSPDSSELETGTDQVSTTSPGVDTDLEGRSCSLERWPDTDSEDSELLDADLEGHSCSLERWPDTDSEDSELLSPCRTTQEFGLVGWWCQAPVVVPSCSSLGALYHQFTKCAVPSDFPQTPRIPMMDNRPRAAPMQRSSMLDHHMPIGELNARRSSKPNHHVPIGELLARAKQNGAGCLHRRLDEGNFHEQKTKYRSRGRYNVGKQHSW